MEIEKGTVVLGANNGVDIGDVGLQAGSNRIGTVSGVQKTVSVTKALDATTDYTAEDVLSEDEAAGSGTHWTFSAIARANAAAGYITKAHVIWETTALTPRLTLYLFDTASTGCELDDNAANTSPLYGEIATYVGSIDFPALSDVGGVSEAVATPSTTGNLPLAFKCAAAADDLFGVMVTRDAITGEAAGSSMVCRLTTDQY